MNATRKLTLTLKLKIVALSLLADVAATWCLLVGQADLAYEVREEAAKLWR